jgi:hypothetical protein
MTTIKTLYVVNHSHTDIGFTDYQDLCFRQHAEFIDAAMDLIEATADYPAEAHYTWICEITGMTEKYLRQASPEQRERFARLNREGSIGVAGMQYNLTPLLTPEQMIRSLYPVRRLRDEYGIEISAAMQCDVNGISWMYADLLPAMGIDFLTMSVNPFRGGVPKPWPCGLWWESPTGQKLLAWNGYHYLFGRSIAKLGDWRWVERDLKQEVDKIEAREDWPFDFMYCQSTHPVRVDNGPPDPRMADFVRDWNAKGNTPRIEFTTPAAFGKVLRERYADQLPTWRGDWLDWWSDGVASSAYETGVSRATHELIPTAEALGAWSAATGTCPWDTARADHLLEQTTLYDEHTWGAFASIERPQDRWVKAQWNRKANFAYTASSEAHDLVARGTGALAHTVATFGPDGMFNLGDLDPNEAYPTPTNSDVLVINALPWQRTVLVDEPEIRGQAAPACWTVSSPAMSPGAASARNRRSGRSAARSPATDSPSCRWRTPAPTVSSPSPTSSPTSTTGFASTRPPVPSPNGSTSPPATITRGRTTATGSGSTSTKRSTAPISATPSTSAISRRQTSGTASSTPPSSARP